jgi:hypothetical protein
LSKKLIVISSRSAPQLQIEHWTLGKGDPRAQAQALGLDRKVVELDSYHMPCSKPIPLIPSISCLIPPDGVSIYPSSSIIRVGSKFFAGVDADRAGSGKLTTNFDDKIGYFWEDICTRDDVLVTCRRRVPRNYAFSRQFELDTSSDDDNDHDDHDDDDEKNEQAHLWDVAPAEESWSDSDSATESSSGAGSFGNCSDDGSLDIDSNAPPDLAQEDAAADISDYSADYSAGYASDPPSGKSDGITDDSRSASDSDSFHSGSIYSRLSGGDDGGDGALGEEPGSNYPVLISGPELDVVCHFCEEESMRRRYLCDMCGFSLCRECVGHRRRWCENKGHQLYDMFDSNVVGAISRTRFVIKQELHVYRTRNAVEVTDMLFRYQERFHVLLHESPPVIHPRHTLVVWPLSGSQILFADYEKNSFFVQKIRSGVTRGSKCPLLPFQVPGVNVTPEGQ